MPLTAPHLADLDSTQHMIRDADGAIIGMIRIDSTALGPAAGGCRLWPYESDAAMITDATRLARGMSYKNAMAGLPFGGGKAVLNRPLGAFDRTAYYRALGDAIEALSGAYITAEDVGSTLDDMAVVQTRTRYVSGLAVAHGMAGGEPSLMTARGVFETMKLVAAEMLGLPLANATVAVQGTGQVGAALCHMLKAEGARIILTDVNSDKAAQLATELGAQHVEPDAILSAPADILAPCALGAIFNPQTIPTINAKLICGAANNQLAQDKDGAALKARGIFYAPDYVVNAGGIINATAEYAGESDAYVRARVAQIPARVLDVLREAAAQDLPSNVVADAMAQRIIAAARN